MLAQSTDKPQSMKCVYVAPTKALCTEKYRDWMAKFGGLGVKSMSSNFIREISRMNLNFGNRLRVNWRHTFVWHGHTE